MQDRKICLLIDNFSGHSISYKPTNIHIVFFEPNMTLFVQPLDAGIIRCFKAHYHQQMCLCAIELDNAGEDDIYKVNLHEVMLMANAAWDSISTKSIAACWDHTAINRPADRFDLLSIPFICFTKGIVIQDTV